MEELDQLIKKCQNLLIHHGIAWKNSFIQWDLPSEINADLALNLVLPIAHKTKRSPQILAQEIIQTINYPHWQWTVTPNGYINISLPTSYYQQFLFTTYQQQGNNLPGIRKNKRVNIEFISANPTGYLHLAHFRQGFLGEALANIYRFQGYKVTREYYINDRGGQITALIASVNYFYHYLQGFSGRNNLTTKIEYPGLSSQEAAQYLIKKWGDKYINQELKKDLSDVWKQEILTFILTKIRQDLANCGINFEMWFSENSCYGKNQAQKMLTKLQDKELIYHHEGSIFFRSSLGGDDKDRVIVKQDGDYTYFFSDILYHSNKFQRSDLLINIWGADHHGFIARLKSACQLLGYPTENLQVILVQMTNLLTAQGEITKFSKRAGNTIELSEALKYINKEQLRFFCLEKDPNQPLTINTNLLQEQQEKTRLYYLQYAHARCQQLLKKSREKQLEKISHQINLLGPAERKILNWLIRFSSVLESVVVDNKPHYLIHYLLELTHQWQVYYQNNPILEIQQPELTSQKLLMVKNVQIILKLGLNLLGLTAPDNM